jgi:hypothetical protein
MCLYARAKSALIAMSWAPLLSLARQIKRSVSSGASSHLSVFLCQVVCIYELKRLIKCSRKNRLAFSPRPAAEPSFSGLLFTPAVVAEREKLRDADADMTTQPSSQISKRQFLFFLLYYQQISHILHCCACLEEMFR